MKRKINTKKWIANILAAVILLQFVPMVPVSYATGDQHKSLGHAIIDASSDVTYVRNPSTQEDEYTLQMTVDAEY